MPRGNKKFLKKELLAASLIAFMGMASKKAEAKETAAPEPRVEVSATPTSSYETENTANFYSEQDSPYVYDSRLSRDLSIKYSGAYINPETNEVNIPAQNDDWTTMPKVDSSLEEVKVDSISEVADSTNSTDGVFTSPVSDTEVSTLEPVTSEVQGLNVETPAMSLNNESVSSDNVVSETPLEVSSEETTQTPIVDTSAQETPIETLNTDDTQAEKNSDIWNL